MRVSLCPYCGQPTDLGQVCVHCTRHQNTPASPPVPPSIPFDNWSDETHPTQASMLEFNDDTMLIIQIDVGHAAFLVVRLNACATVGRTDESQVNVPTIDFAKYHGLEYGVSRVHARIDRSENMITLTDLGSRNGTYINQQWCRPHSNYLIRDNDEIMFGRLKTRVHFRSEAVIQRATLEARSGTAPILG
jgi:pSer/pThr/pTyr-binding forkhead associated (FHA) protein